MKKRDNQKMNMYNTVLNICKEQQAAWVNIPSFASAIADLEAQLAELNHTHSLRSTSTAGVSATKQAIKLELVDHMYILCKALSLKGLELHDLALDLRNRIALSKLKTISANDLLHRMEILEADLAVHGSSLESYGISAQYINETLTLVTNTREILFTPRLAIISRKGLTASLKEQTKRIDALIKNQLDTLILSFKAVLPSFYNAYQNARIVIDYGHSPDGGGLERDDGTVH